MDRAEFSKLFDTYAQDAFRLQTLTRYRVGHEDVDFQRFLAGHPFPDRTGNAWLDQIARNARAGKRLTNVHVLPERLTPYLRYLIDWWYVYWQEAGAEVRFVLPADAKQVLPHLPSDFWLFDGAIAVSMRYDPEGQFLGPERAEDVESYRQAKELALRHSVGLREVLALRRGGELL